MNKVLDPDLFHRKAEELIARCPEEDALSWAQHPCTKSLVSSLNGDMIAILAGVLDGDYSEQGSVDASAQMIAKARGMAQAIADVIERVIEIGTTEKED